MAANFYGISQEDWGIINYVRSSGLSHVITCTTNHTLYVAGTTTVSRHRMNGTSGLGLAVDVGGHPPNSNGLAAIFNAFLKVETQLYELIYAGPQVSFNIKAGKRVNKYSQVAHDNHVHISVKRGVILKWPGQITPQKITSYYLDGLMEGKKVKVTSIGVSTDSSGNGYSDSGIGVDKVFNASINPAIDVPKQGYTAGTVKWGNWSGQCRVIVTGARPKSQIGVNVYSLDG
jgi:hypothetical protein